MKLDWIDWRILRDLVLVLVAGIVLYGVAFLKLTGRI